MAKELSEEQDESLEESGLSETETLNENGSVSQEEELIRCSEELAAEKDQRLRLAAEFANYRRRVESQRTEWSKRAKAEVIRAMLPVLDDLERSLTVAEETGSEDSAFVSLRGGISLVHENFSGELRKFGLRRIQTAEVAFDEQLHEAVGHAPPTEEQKDGHVVYESQAGYRLGDQVLRHAKVIVAVSPEPTEEEVS